MNRISSASLILFIALSCSLLSEAEGAAANRTISVVNKCPYKLYTFVTNGYNPRPGGLAPSQSKGLRALDAGASYSTTVPKGWTAGRVWAERDGYPVYPQSLAEFGMNAYMDLDFYDISLVDGYSTPLSIKVNGGTGSCESITCSQPTILSQCPAGLQVMHGGKTVACKSACSAYSKDSDCCQGTYNNSKVCKPSATSKWFKGKCADAYSYPYDDATSTFTCKGASYTVTFCP